MITTEQKPSIQITLFDYFMDIDTFTIQDAQRAVKEAELEVKEPSVRARIYEGINKGLFERVGKNAYTVKRKDADGNEATCMLLNGNGRDLSFLSDNSIDSIITDHPYALEKSLKGGNRDFATYDSFLYDEKDMQEKFRVLKDGCFLVEFLPEENGDNFEYIYQVKAMAKKAGFDYFATVPWKKGDFVANTGRKSKNTEQVLFFTKGKCRELRLDAKKNKAFIQERQILCFNETLGNNFDDEQVDLSLFVKKEDREKVYEILHKNLDDWANCSCEESPLIPSEYSEDEIDVLYNTPIQDYLLEVLDFYKIDYIDLTGKIDVDLLVGVSEKKVLDTITNVLIENAPEKLSYMSGAKGMLPTVFDVEPVSKNDKIHQAEKPVELLEQILNFVSLPQEKVLDQFAGSGVLGEAALNQNRDSILIEKNEETFHKACERVERVKRGKSR